MRLPPPLPKIVELFERVELETVREPPLSMAPPPAINKAELPERLELEMVSVPLVRL